MNSKYRIVKSNSPDYSYDVEKKTWYWWCHVTSTRHLEDAEYHIKRIFESKKHGGKVIKEYDSQDFLIDKLKG